MTEKHIDGYEVPVHRALISRIMVLGVPKNLGIGIGTIIAAQVFAFHTLYGVPICLLFQAILAFQYRKEEYWGSVYWRAFKHKTFYSV